MSPLGLALPEVGAGIGALFLFGLASSVHCLAMCGGFFLVPAAVPSTGASIAPGRLAPHAAYNAGRLVSYTALGALLGGLGSALSLPAAARGIVALVAGAFLVAIGLSSLGAVRLRLSRAERAARSIATRLLELRPRLGSSATGSFALGSLTALMPCAPLQATLFAALGSGSAFSGAASALAFAAGTIPMMLGVGLAADRLASIPALARRARITAGAIVVILGALMAGRGLVASGLSAKIASALSFDTHLEASLPPDACVARIDRGVQRVDTRVEPMAFHPIVVQRALPVEWTIRAAVADLNEHSSTFSVPDLGIERRLIAGDNLVDFTAPDVAGEIDYSSLCAMIRSKIYVVDDLGRFAKMAKRPESGTARKEQLP